MARTRVGGTVPQGDGRTEAPSGPGKALGVEDIVAAAMRVGTTKGFASLTMRALADELGVSAMAAYHHVPNKEALVTLIIDAILVKVEVPPPDFGDWFERLTELGARSDAVLQEKPGFGMLVFENAITAQGRRIMDGYMSIMLDGGFSRRNAFLGFNILHAYGVGRWVLERRLRPNRGVERQRGWADRPGAPDLESEWAAYLPDLHGVAETVILNGLRQILAEQNAADEE